MKASSQGKTEGSLLRRTFPSRVPFVKLTHSFCCSPLSLSHKAFHIFKAFLEEWNMLSFWIPVSHHPLKSLGIREEKRAAKNILIQMAIIKQWTLEKSLAVGSQCKHSLYSCFASKERTKTPWSNVVNSSSHRNHSDALSRWSVIVPSGDRSEKEWTAYWCRDEGSACWLCYLKFVSGPSQFMTAKSKQHLPQTKF